MDMETKIAIIILAFVVISAVILHFTEDKVRFTYHDQKVGVRTKWWRR